MSSKKQKKKELVSKPNNILSSIRRYFLALPSTALDIQILGGAILLLILVIAGKLMSKEALIFAAVTLSYFLLRYIAKRFDKGGKK